MDTMTMALSALPDEIKEPDHYQTGGREVIEFIKEMGWFKQYALANIMKYACRCQKKGQYKEDLQKIIVYATMLLEDEK